MIDKTVYALLSTNAYADIRIDPRNVAPLPVGWSVVPEFDVSDSGNNTLSGLGGFTARVYQGPNGEIVIS